jgi:hypothetical protein
MRFGHNASRRGSFQSDAGTATDYRDGFAEQFWMAIGRRGTD